MASGQYPGPVPSGNGYYPQPGTPPVRQHHHKNVGGLVTLIILFMVGLLGAGLFLIVQFFGTIIHDTFGDCSNTPKAAASLSAMLERQGVRTVAVEYDCSRDATAVVNGDKAHMYIALDYTYTSAAELQEAVVIGFEGEGWAGADNVVTKGGYSLTVDPHSYQPALVHLTLEREKLGSNSHAAWDTKKERLDEIEFSQQDIQRYALLPFYLPSYVPEGYEQWENGYSVFTEYKISTRQKGHGTVPLLRVQQMSPQCGIVEECSQVKILSNGLTLYKVGDVKEDLEEDPQAYINGDYVVFIDGVAISYSEATSYEDGEELPKKPLQEDEIIAIFESITMASPAPAR